MSELTQPWIWYALGLALIWLFLQLADWYLETRPLTDEDEWCALSRFNWSSTRTTLLLAGDLDAQVDREWMEREFVSEIELWLIARSRYEEQS